MAKTPKDVLFFIRAYNDLDVQLSLITSFAADKRFRVRVVFYHSDGFITHVRAHEAVSYVEEHYGVTFDSVLNMKGCPLWLRLLYFIKKTAYKCRRNDAVDNFLPLALLFKGLDAGIGKLIQPALLKKNPGWLYEIAKSWNPVLVFCDEVLFQRGRSPVIDTLAPVLAERGAAVYTILTGHRVYTAVNPTGKESTGVYTPSLARCYFVPSAHNERIYSQLFPEEKIVVGGNLRFDREWVKTLHEKVFTLPVRLPNRPVKIAMMLSKLDYGVDAEQIKETIRRLGRMDGVALAIKPHTRAMRFDFMSEDEIGDAVIADRIPSTSLIEWADIILMTGSSIVFHAMLRGKVAGFLKYCQQLETIFDDGKSCTNFESLEQLVSYTQAAKKSGIPPKSPEGQKNLEEFIAHEVHGDVEDGLTARNHMDIILSETGIGDE